MNKQTLKALNASIEKWKQNVIVSTPEQVKIEWRECPLCLLFNNHNHAGWPANRCQGCPVAAAAGEIGCGNTPYEEAETALLDWEDALGKIDAPVCRADFRRAALEEVIFLESLVPETKE